MSDPRQKDFDERHTKLPTVTALTKREYFAALAMQSIITNASNSDSATDEGIANAAVILADELLKALKA